MEKKRDAHRPGIRVSDVLAAQSEYACDTRRVTLDRASARVFGSACGIPNTSFQIAFLFVLRSLNNKWLDHAPLLRALAGQLLEVASGVHTRTAGALG